MKETDIRKYAELMKELGLTGLEIKDDTKVVRLEYPAQPVKEIVPVETVTRSSVESAPSIQDYISVKSPVVGVFYAAATENVSPYVTIGDMVKKGQTLCIVEAMKLMNEIIAEEDGVISQVCVTNGQVVEYGTELFRIKR